MAQDNFGNASAESELDFDSVTQPAMRSPEMLDLGVSGSGSGGGGDSSMEEFVGRMGWTKEKESDFFSRVPLPPILIAVMGKKSSGKTSFINAAAGVSGLDPSTQGIRFVAAELCGRSVTFIDTPGCDADMSGVISQCLEAAASKGAKISGAIYLHRITDPQMDGSHTMNTRRFSKLCGDDNFQNVILCTTMWEKVAGGTMREKQLCGDSTFWGDMIREGALVERHQGPDLGASARRVAEILVNKRLIALQNQVLLENKAFFETASGKMWIGEMEEMKGKHARESQQLKAELRAAVAARTARDEEFALVEQEVVEQMGRLRARLQDADLLLKAQPLMQLMWRVTRAQGKISDAGRLAVEISDVLASHKSPEKEE